MVLTIIAILIVLWLLGWLVFNLGAFIHVLLIIALVWLVWHLLTMGRRHV
ncbi:MAG TPA: lmo0937 family membrane protein [Candidatus Saccharimonadales bacterium]|nr:lmo0937 family membrane protein [Candidatus Saccharimonadales bacterium]